MRITNPRRAPTGVALPSLGCEWCSRCVSDCMELCQGERPRDMVIYVVANQTNGFKAATSDRLAPFFFFI